ncbi:hypothetical protein CgunFtcFv8_026755 [Champsocephalus gunnari]|uniref:KN motif and ankyrin repeat domain-containing protein 4 n=1 Tax=Champsocephalus gunnari TaxID=52237 RepID=A0AAN8E176_CHAGU|nr:hypothetical protein CgunFtcFv8_026755 [Champsocephalus gunnari]
MMDKKSANGFQTKASEGGVQRKQLPYSVETPYGFHLDLDFLKYVDDIEKGNTIKRVHIQRRVKGPAKFSTLPRNFSLPGHGARPTPREKDSTWSGTSTLGPKPKSRVTEVQQIYDFRASEGGKSSQSSRGTSSRGAVYVSEKPKDESGAGALAVEEKAVGFQSRPNLLRASSMPITLQQRKGSDSSSPDRNAGTPESGSTENMFRASPDITDRRSLPQDRGGLHQQITVALKRVRELEEQVKTIPELKAQISSLRKEREDLMIQIQAQIQAQAQAEAQVSTSSSIIASHSDSGTHFQPQGQRPTEGLNLALKTQPTGGLDASERLSTKLVAKMVAEAAAVSPPRPRANSIERGTVTERIATQDQMTETPTAVRVNQVTETEGEIETDHPQRPRASSVEMGTVTERVDTVDRVTETVEAQRTDQQTETELGRRQDNNPSRGAEAESQVRECAGSERVEYADTVVIERVEEKEANERRGSGDSESVVMKVVTEIAITAKESTAEQILVPKIVSEDEGSSNPPVAEIENIESKIEMIMAQNDSEIKEMEPLNNEVTEIIETQQVAPEIVEEKQIKEHAIVSATIKETVVTDMVVVAAAENEAAKAVVPVRPQRGRRPSAEQAQPSPPSPPQPQAAPVRPSRGSSETLAQESLTKDPPQVQVQGTPHIEAQTPTQQSEQQVKQQASSLSQVEDQSPAEKPPGESSEKQSESQPQIETQGPSPGSTDVQTHPKSIKAQPKTSAARRDTKEPKAPRGSGEAHTRPTRQGSSTAKPQSQGSRRSSSETQPPHKDVSETQSLRRGSSETAQRRNSSEAQALRRDAGEAEPSRRGSGESPTSPAALGHVVTRLTGLLGEQWAQLGSSTGTQQTASQQESPSTQKQTPGKKTEAAKGAKTKPAGKAIPAATTAKPGGKPGPSKMSSIQSQLVSSLSVLSAFYSPGQKAAAASKQQEQGLKSIMKKNGVADKQGNKGAKKNLKFVGVNGGYESTSSEESSGDEKSKVEVEKQDSSEPEVEKEKETEPQTEEKPEEGAETQQQETEVAPEGGGAVAAEKEAEKGLLDPEGSEELLGEQEEGEKVEQSFIDACFYVKDRMEEVSSPDKEMRQVLVVLYQEWFKISSQKDSQADTVTLYLRQVGLTTPTLLPYVVNLTDGNGNMALHYSVSHSNFPVVKLLLDTGLCETNNVNKAGYTPVMLAALTAAESPDDLEVAQQLLRQGDVNACSRQAGQTALMLAVSHGRVAMVKLLLSCGTDVNAQDREGSTALMCASEHGHTNIVRMLLETGRCDISLIDKNGQSALSVAEAASHQEIVDLLKTHAETRASD